MPPCRAFFGDDSYVDALADGTLNDSQQEMLQSLQNAILSMAK